MSGETEQIGTETSPASDDVNWLELDGLDDVGAPGAPAESAEPPATPATPPAVQTPQTPAASPEPSQPTAQQPVPGAQQPQTQVAQPQQLPQGQTPEERIALYQQALEQAYAVSADDATALLTQPELVFPKLATNLHMNVMKEVQSQMQQMMQAIPQLLQAEASRVQVEESAKTEFYGQWPGLQAHHAAVVSNANMLRKANPTATKEQLIEMTGVMTAMALGLDPTAVRKAVAQQQQRQQMPRQPLRPIGSSGAPAPLEQAPAQQNIFSAFADEDLSFGR